MSPQDFDLFPKLKQPLRGLFFWKFFSTDGTRVIRHMDKSGVLDGIIILKHWVSVTEKQGDYTEGLWTDNLKEINVLVKKYIVCITFQMTSLL